MIRVLIADDHQLVREGIRAVMAQADDIEIVAEATTGQEALDLTRRERPDVLVLDITMPVVNGIEVAATVRDELPGTEVVMLSMHADPSVIREAIEVGARGYVLKESVADELILAVRSANRGATYLTTVASESLLSGSGDTPPAGPDAPSLTEREWEVLQLIGEGMTNRTIGTHLGISIKTVERHRTNLMAKLDAHSVVELVRAGIKIGAITLED